MIETLIVMAVIVVLYWAANTKSGQASSARRQQDLIDKYADGDDGRQ